jgi:hypothetical protein
MASLILRKNATQQGRLSPPLRQVSIPHHVPSNTPLLILSLLPDKQTASRYQPALIALQEGSKNVHFTLNVFSIYQCFWPQAPADRGDMNTEQHAYN